ncbi:MAG TPA: GNAT family N-acetyltransferase [Pirellulales bacterium]|nr:GNAT family N-acetyltransferase [Pirellulales bacterium]
MSTALAATEATTTIVRARSFDALVDLKATWNELAGQYPTRRYEWCEAWWRHWGTPGNNLLVALIYDEQGMLIGIAPWYVERSMLSGRVLRFLGSGEACSDFLSILARLGRERDVAERLAEWLVGEQRDEWDLLDLEAVATEDETCAVFAHEMQRRGHLVNRRQSLNTWRIALPANWDDFVQGMSKPNRRKVRTLETRAISTDRAKLHVVRERWELKRAFDVLCELHERRRQSLGQRGCFSSARFTQFHRDIAAIFFEAGILRLSWTELDGKPVAADYGFNLGNIAYAYQSGIAPEAASENPGWLQITLSLRAAIEQGYAQFDFLRGDERYKSAWRAEPVPLVDLQIVSRRAMARGRHAAAQFTSALRCAARYTLSSLRSRTKA